MPHPKDGAQMMAKMCSLKRPVSELPRFEKLSLYSCALACRVVGGMQMEKG